MTYLLDVNTLFALLWPPHIHHVAAHLWFTRAGHRSWATNAITRLGALRLLTNRAATQGSVTHSGALNTIAGAASHPGHQYWPLDQDINDALRPFAPRMQGHRQWTDALLLSHAIQHSGALVTFDEAIKTLASRDASRHVLVLG